MEQNRRGRIKVCSEFAQLIRNYLQRETEGGKRRARKEAVERAKGLAIDDENLHRTQGFYADVWWGRKRMKDWPEFQRGLRRKEEG